MSTLLTSNSSWYSGIRGGGDCSGGVKVRGGGGSARSPRLLLDWLIQRGGDDDDVADDVVTVVAALVAIVARHLVCNNIEVKSALLFCHSYAV